MRVPRLRSSPSFFHPSTNRRMYRFASNGEIGDPCGMPRRLSRASVVRVLRPRSSVSSTGHSSHIAEIMLLLIFCLLLVIVEFLRAEQQNVQLREEQFRQADVAFRKEQEIL